MVKEMAKVQTDLWSAAAGARTRRCAGSAGARLWAEEYVKREAVL